MKKMSFNHWALIFSLLMLLITIGALIAGNSNIAGICLVLMCIALSYGVQAFQATKGLMLTMWILASVCVAMFFPQYFINWGSDAKPFILEKKLMTPLLQIIMFGMGAQMSLNDFAGVMKRPGSVAVGVLGRFVVGPLLAFVLVAIFGNMIPVDDPSTRGLIIGGIFLVAVLPCGLASNVMNMLASANLALGVTIGATTTLLAPFAVPFLMQVFASDYVPDLNPLGMMFSIFKMVIFPIIAGFVFNLFNLNKENMKTKLVQLSSFFAVILLAGILGKASADGFNYIKESAISTAIFIIAPAVVGYLLYLQFKGDQTLVKKVLGKLSQIGIITIVLVITAAGQQILVKAGVLLVLLVMLHNALGYLLGYCIAWMFRMPEQDRRSLAFEIGMPNAGLGSGLAPAIGPAAIGLAAAIYGPVMNIFGSTLASIWKGNPPKDGKEKNK
ncbi:MAG: bile acid:sodium symporter family protein [Bacteroidales bacterium]|jgi:BASS family bile acid:Na+ symporter|nr:bile acid:sodium symporter family protein [Bacteroidales bacterium]